MTIIYYICICLIPSVIISACHVLGSVPPFYREVYDIVCPNQEHVDQDMFVQILVQSSLPRTTVMQVIYCFVLILYMHMFANSL